MSVANLRFCLTALVFVIGFLPTSVVSIKSERASRYPVRSDVGDRDPLFDNKAVNQLDLDSDDDPLNGRGFGGLAKKWAGECAWPPGGYDASRQEVNIGVLRIEMLIIALALVGCSGCSFLLLRSSTVIGADDKGNGGHALASSMLDATSRPPARSMPTFFTHLHALVSSIVWQQLHSRAIIYSLLRICGPTLYLVMLHYLRNHLEDMFGDKEWTPILLPFGTKPDQVVDAILDYFFTVMVLVSIMMSMGTFVSHVAVESETGFRHLLHVSGLSRPAYLVATCVFDGVALAMQGPLVMLIVCSSLLRIRVVIASSPLLLVVQVGTLAVSAVLIGFLTHILSWSARMAGWVSQFITVIVIFSAPFSPSYATIPERVEGGQSWKTLALPVMSAYRAMYEMARGCWKGQCLMLSDIPDAFHGGNWTGPTTMALGASKPMYPTPPEGIISLWGLIVIQLILGWTIVVFWDMRRHPALNTAGQKAAASSTNDAPILEVKDLVHYYGWIQGRAQQARTLNGVSFAIPPGGMLGLLGPNGAGKTTAIRCITGEEVPCQGSVAIREAGNGSAGALVGLCPQETIVNESLTVRENLLFYSFLRGVHGADAAQCAVHFLKATKLEDKHDWLPDTLSGGMRRRLAVACAMIATPAVAVLDEPTTGLDPMSRRGIWGAISEMKATGSCCLLTTHMLEEAEALCSTLVILRRGSVAAQGTVQHLKDMWGSGYMLSTDSNAGEEEQAKSYLTSVLPADQQEPIKVSSPGQMTFKVSNDPEEVGHLFIKLAKGAGSNGIKHWGISQASLEDTYLRIISEPSPEEESKQHVDPGQAV